MWVRVWNLYFFPFPLWHFQLRREENTHTPHLLTFTLPEMNWERAFLKQESFSESMAVLLLHTKTALSKPSATITFTELCT